jgi:sulfatase modifying factor 1
MPQNRREFLGIAAKAGVVGLTRAGLAGAIAHAVSDPADAAPASPQVRTFRGRTPGEERVVDGVRMCWCPPGQFVMGSPPAEAGHRPDESQVPVTLTHGFWTAKAEVTQAGWKRVVGTFPDRPPSSRFGKGDDFPVYWVNFHESEEFCSNLTRRAHRSGALPRQWEFRLPTEAQWEYACRAGTRTATAFGDVVSLREVNFSGVWQSPDRRSPRVGSARPVGSYPANAWGIHDMHGNVWEWCRDWYLSRLPGGVDPDLYNVAGVQNGDGTYSRVRRGGAWIEDGWACRSACRLRYEPPRRSDHIGFRVVAVEIG